MDNELIPCPWCGKLPTLKSVADRSDSGWIYACENEICSINPRMKHYRFSEISARAVWNNACYIPQKDKE